MTVNVLDQSVAHVKKTKKKTGMYECREDT